MIWDFVFERSPHATSWQRIPCEDWIADFEGGQWRTFDPAEIAPPLDQLDAILEAVNRLSPWCRVVVGPTLAGRAGEHFNGVLLIACPPLQSPLSTFWHELHHELAPRLTGEAREVLEAHGDELRAQPHYFDEAWFQRDGEAEALAFQRWKAGGGDLLGIEHPAEVIAIWEAMTK